MIVGIMFCALCLLICSPKPISLAKTPSSSSNPPRVKDTPKSPKKIEYGVKAAFIYNIMKFVEWPHVKKAQADTEKESPTPMIIGIIGDNPFGDVFEPILGKTIQKRKIVLQEIEGYSSFGDQFRKNEKTWRTYCQQYQELIASCDVLFVCQSEKEYLDGLVALTQNHMILTISDIPKFAKDKGVVGFVKDDNKVRFEINLSIAKQEKIEIRTQLLKLAMEVYQK